MVQKVRVGQIEALVCVHISAFSISSLRRRALRRNPFGELCKSGVAAPRQRATSVILLGNAAVCRHAATVAGSFAEISFGILGWCVWHYIKNEFTFHASHFTFLVWRPANSARCPNPFLSMAVRKVTVAASSVHKVRRVVSRLSHDRRMAVTIRR